MLIIIALACLLLLCVYTVFTHQSRTRQCLAHLPTYPQLPLIGSAHYFIGDGRKMFQRLMEMTEISEKKQEPFVVWMGPYAVLVLTDLDDIKSVTNEFVEKPYYYKFSKIWLGEGILTTSAAIWKHNIKKLGGAFNVNAVEIFQDVFNSQAQKLVDKLKTVSGQGTFNVMENYLAETTLETICQIALGVPKISNSILTEDYYKAFLKTLDIIKIRGYNILLHSDLLFNLSPYKKEMVRSVSKLHHVSETALKIRQQHADPKKTYGSHTNDTEKTNGNFKSYMDILLELNAKDPLFNMEQVRNEIDTIILAGQETVATSLFYILLVIGGYPDVQNKLYAEIKQIFGDSKREVRKEDLARMTYCEAVIYEALRVYPPAPGVFRVADHEIQLKSCTVPKGVNCAINIIGAGRSKKYWGSDADQFRPERFESGSIPPVLAFSSGRRACIGKKYAMALIKTIIVYCLRELELSAEVNKIQLQIDLALRTVSEKLLEVKIRQQ